MSSEPHTSFVERSLELFDTGRFRNFLAQSHSRDVLRHLGTPKEEWPEYTGRLDEDLAYTAQYLLYLGLRLKGSAETEAAGDENLTLGPEIVRHGYARSGDGDPERVTQLLTAALA